MTHFFSGISIQRLRVIGWSFAAVMLLIPAVVMQFTSEMNWGAEDFAAFAVMLIALGLGVELTFRFIRTNTQRLLAGALLLGLFLLTWAHLAVGL